MIIKFAKRALATLMVVTLTAMTISACEKNEISEPLTYSWEEASIYEAEEGKFFGDVYVDNSLDGYSGEGYVTGLVNEVDGLSLQIDIEEEGFYDLNVVSSSQGADYKENYIYVDDRQAGSISVQSESFTNSVLERVFLTKGSHEVSIMKFWGWINIDKLLVKKSDELNLDMYKIDKTLINKNANENARKLYSYMVDIYGEKILSGQYSQGMFGLENTAIHDETGEYPAILGLDFMDYTPSRVAMGTVGNTTDAAINYWNNGGIVTFCWHWNAPEKYITGTWYSAFYTEHTNIDIEKIMNGQDEEGYDLLMEDIDAIAKELQILQEAGVPVLWRPLHEASGGWFWWGAKGPEAYKQLYILLYKKLTKEYGLNNLIWIWNGQDSEWYPGDEYVDIIGWDIYPGEKIYSSQAAIFLEAAACSQQNKMIVLSENGCLFDPDLAFRDSTKWGFFCTWEGEFVLKNPGYNKYGDKYTEVDMLKKVYSDSRVITRDELPDIKSYPIDE